jgi:hypothetical protein
VDLWNPARAPRPDGRRSCYVGTKGTRLNRRENTNTAEPLDISAPAYAHQRHRGPR